MRYRNFKMKLVSLVLVAGALWQYQQIAHSRAAVVAQHDAQVAEINAYNESILQAEAVSPYQDGTYQGTGTGFGGSITVELTIADGTMTEINVLSADGEDPAYYNQAVSVLDEMIAAQSTEVDAVSGATYSSKGLMEATAEALGKAVNEK